MEREKISLNFLRRGSFRRKIFNFAEKLGVAFVEYSGAKEYLETRTQHAPHGHLSVLLKTDCNPTSMLRRDTRAPVCVSPGRAPGGNTRRSGVHRVSSCFLSLCSRILSQHHFFFGEVENFSAKRPMSLFFLLLSTRFQRQIRVIYLLHTLLRIYIYYKGFVR